MYIRWRPRKLKPNGSKRWGCTTYYASLMRSYRENGKTKKETLASLGSFRFRNAFSGPGYCERKEEFLNRVKDEFDILAIDVSAKKILVDKILEYIKSVERRDDGPGAR